MERRNKLQVIFEKVGTKSFVRIARKNGLVVPYSNEIGNISLTTFLNDSILDGYLYDTEEDEEWISKWYDQVIN